MTAQNNHELQALQAEVAALRESIKDLVDAWNTARGVVLFVKWVGSLATAATALWALFQLGHSK